MKLKVRRFLAQVFWPVALGLGSSFSLAGAAADGTFSDAKWISMNPSIPGAAGEVDAAVVDGSGNLYIGGSFTFVGDVRANNIAKWDGSWSALGAGMGGSFVSEDPSVRALAVSGTNLYAAGLFTTAGGKPANRIAKWNGSSWSALGSGLGGAGLSYDPVVIALAVSGNNVYAGGDFTSAGGVSARYIAKWDGTNW